MRSTFRHSSSIVKAVNKNVELPIFCWNVCYIDPFYYKNEKTTSLIDRNCFLGLGFRGEIKRRYLYLHKFILTRGNNILRILFIIRYNVHKIP